MGGRLSWAGGERAGIGDTNRPQELTCYGRGAVNTALPTDSITKSADGRWMLPARCVLDALKKSTSFLVSPGTGVREGGDNSQQQPDHFHKAAHTHLPVSVLKTGMHLTGFRSCSW